VSNLHRLAWVDAQIRARRYPNASSVAQQFEISRRQAARDLEYLRHSMGAPLGYSAKHRGYYYIDDAFVLPAMVMSDVERSSLSYLAERYSGADGEAAARVAGVLRRLTGRAVADSGSKDRPPVAGVDSREMRALDKLRIAIETRTAVATRYRGADGVVVKRTLSPYALLTRFGVLTCIAYSEEVGVTLSFPLNRFESIESTDRRFEVPRLFDIRDWDEERRPLPTEPFTAIVRLNNPADAERLESAQAVGEGVYRIEFFESAAILSSLLSCHSGFEIVSPRWLRQRLRSELEKLLRAHS
jgi:predicted DNA-binding transcriptional regulator YafY